MGIKGPDKVGKKARDAVPLSEKVRVRSGHPIPAVCMCEVTCKKTEFSTLVPLKSTLSQKQGRIPRI